MRDKRKRLPERSAIAFASERKRASGRAELSLVSNAGVHFGRLDQQAALASASHAPAADRHWVGIETAGGR
jgi:hypothetical protein